MTTTTNNITFVKAGPEHEKIIFSWLAEPHMMEFWDNSQEHKDDILNFLHNRTQQYFYGTTMYFIGLIDTIPYSFLLADILQPDQDLSDVHKKHMSKSGQTIGLDFGIGNTNFLGKGLATITLEKFTQFYRDTINSQADTFFIDPDKDNPRAAHVYAKAGFKLVGEYRPRAGAFIGSSSLLMVKKLSP